MKTPASVQEYMDAGRVKSSVTRRSARRREGGLLISETHWCAWTGGVLSIALTMTGLTLAHKMGSGLYTGPPRGTSVQPPNNSRVGDQDGLKAGAAELHDILDKYGIANNFEIYSGTHTSAVVDRLQNHVMPFFSQNLCSAKNSN